MKKVLALTAIVLVLLIALTGCVNVNYEVTLNKDGTADIAYVYGFEKESLQKLGSTSESMTNDMKQNAENGGYEIEPYSDDTIEGFKAKKHVDNLSDISLEETFGSENITDSEENQFRIEKKGLKTVYSQNAKIDLSSMDSTTASVVKMKYTVKLPTKVGDNNASEVSEDGKTLTWNLAAGEINEINFEASSSNLVVEIIVIVVIAIVVIGVVIILLKKSKKDKKENSDDNKETSVVLDSEAEELETHEEEKIDEVEEDNDDKKQDEE